MEKIKPQILLLILMSLFLSCEVLGDFEEYDNPWDSYESYLSITDYNALLDNLDGLTGINKTVIDEQLDLLNVRQNYDSSFYDGGTNLKYGMNWNSWSSYGWIYYRAVSIWVDDSGNLNRSMCSYYQAD